MAEQPLDYNGSQQIQEISREEILKQIFGDIGELIDGALYLHIFYILLHTNVFVYIRLYVCCGKYGLGAWQDVYNKQVHLFLFKLVWVGKEDSDSLFAY